MRIGIDIDDTITNTTEMMMKYINKSGIAIDSSEDYCNFKVEQLDKYRDLLEKYIEPVLTNVSVKKDCVSVISKLKEEGNTIYIITARSNRYSDNIYNITVDYLNKNNIIYDKLLFGYENKRDVCLKEKIDYMIDDNINVYDSLVGTSTKPILFSKGNNRFRVDSWSEILDVLK